VFAILSFFIPFFQTSYHCSVFELRHFAVLLKLFLVELLSYVPEVYFNAKIDAAVTANYSDSFTGETYWCEQTLSTALQAMQFVG
jgi:hypothetical protein